ncbi:MAG: Efflux ABC transporter, permease/ATP-binding protein [uncultured Thermomicrobiales bacterium]|uniref:Efflux ABC transporter, permease/ATP-binding protein n=1 Tax=uncultured Thermomicrobiales bacterium TaxID=1645740 RepID=A0A6J4UMF3_9BACT|nr:MAG: Efflux ABC transporter, permease/ATP-binding protein [uncultured Thermomicrobiales bacterium]
MFGWFRNYRMVMGFGFKSAPRQAAFFLVSGAVMSLIYPAAAYGYKLLVDAAVDRDTSGILAAVVVLSAAAGIGLVNGLYYIDLLFSVAERASGEVDRRLIRLMGGVPGIEHHELPEHIDRLDLLREQRALLGWMTNATAGLLRVAVQLIASGVLLARLHPALLLLPLFGTVSFVAGRRAQEVQRRAEESTAGAERLRRHLFETGTEAAAGKEVRVFGLLDTLLNRHQLASDAVMRERNRAEWLGAGLQSVGALVSGAAYAAAIGLVLVLAVQGSATPGDVVLAVGLAAGMNAIVSTAVFYGAHFLRVLRAADRYLWLERYARQSSRIVADPLPAPARLERGIRLDSISFRYVGMDEDVLSGVDLWLPAGSVVAIVGENGAGKSTLVKILCGLYEPTAGRILVDGVDVSRMDREGWRDRVSAAFQDFVRFEFLARESVGVGDVAKIASERDVGAALDRAQASDLRGQLPQGLETQLGKDWKDGVELSGGQWQKLALGRAMMRERPLLLMLDEPTASLDAQTEHALFARYTSAARRAAEEAGTVTVLVSHRFSTVRMADLIAVLDGGRIRELGSHEELMTLGGLYAELYELQARAYR